MEVTSNSAYPELFCDEEVPEMNIDVDEATQAVPDHDTPEQSRLDPESQMESVENEISDSPDATSEETDENPGPSKSTPIRKRRRRTYVSNFLTGKARLVLSCKHIPIDHSPLPPQHPSLPSTTPSPAPTHTH